MTKLIIQIPCFNEEQLLGVTLNALPREMAGIDRVEWLIIDDGSQDNTAAVARRHGVDHIVSLKTHQGLARAFMAGLDAAIAAGADIIVNTDADNQYCADDIIKLVSPILEGRADIIIGSRPIDQIQHFSPLKKWLQKAGSRCVIWLSKRSVDDAPSGFRAFSREAASRLNVFTEYTYTLETLIQARQKHMVVLSVPVRVNSELRPSRLIKHIPAYLWQSIITLSRVFIIYHPLRFFMAMGGLVFLSGFLIGGRFLLFYLFGDSSGHLESLILATLLMSMGFLVMISGVIADLIAVNRKLLEKLDWRIHRLEEGAKATKPDRGPRKE